MSNVIKQVLEYARIGHTRVRQADGESQAAFAEHWYNPLSTQSRITTADTSRLDEVQTYKAVMVADGWCHHQVTHLSHQYDLDTFKFIASRRISPYRAFDHSQCSKLSDCIAHNTSLSRHKITHVTAECTCEMLSVSHDKLLKIIRKDKVPLVAIEEIHDSASRYRLKLHSRSRKSRYVAISHIWADGLGIPSPNALPLCQIIRLRARLLDLWRDLDPMRVKKHMLFWMDTLCIPAKREDKALKLMQIDRMASIYRDSLCTLVFDLELMFLKPEYELSTCLACGSNSSEQRLSSQTRARIACCAWMSRSWPLQEGRLSRLIAVMFADRMLVFGPHKKGRKASEHIIWYSMGSSYFAAVKSSTLGKSVVASINQLRRAPLLARCCDYRHSTDEVLEEAFLSTLFSDNTSFAAAWNELAGRSTTMPEDLAYIVANILEMGNVGLFKYQVLGEMLEAILLSLPSVPLSIFFNGGPKLDPHGDHRNRWDPSRIGPEYLHSNALVEVQSGHFLYRYKPNNSSCAAYIVNDVVLMFPGLNFMLGNDEIPWVADCDEADLITHKSKEILSTCIFVERPEILGHSASVRAACFYFLEGDKSAHGTSLVFNCAFRLHRPTRVEPKMDDLNAYAAHALEYPREFRIMYDTPRNFERLMDSPDKIQQDCYEAFWKVVRYGTIAGVIPCIAFTFLLYLLHKRWLEHTRTAPRLALLFGGCATAILISFLLARVVGRRYAERVARKHVQRIEDIAYRYPQTFTFPIHRQEAFLGRKSLDLWSLVAMYHESLQGDDSSICSDLS